MVLIYINEAHTSLWPLGFTDHPEPQVSQLDRLERAKSYIQQENPDEIPYPVLVDRWDKGEQNTFEELYHAWPDKYILLDGQNQQILQKSEYHQTGDDNGRIKVDCVILLDQLLSKV